jgi:nicotinate-nucleotide--dimethylbenzimidazole phosphoribosyltransferase
MHIPHLPFTRDDHLSSALQAAIDNKTKPLGSLGVLEFVAQRIGLIKQSATPSIERAAVIVFAADHGIVAENVSAYPQSVTWQMVENFLADGAAINVFARQNQCALHIVDAGVNHDFGPRHGLIDRKVAAGTHNFAQQPAMTQAQCEQALQAGMDLLDGIDADVIGFGEMGIGNTTAAAALMHKFTGIAVVECVGAGAGLAAEGVRHKQQVIERALALHASASAPLEILRTFGGFEIAMITGAMLRAAERRMVVLVDGFIVTSALLVAAALQPAMLDYCLFSHCSDEQGHRRMLQHLQARPLMQLDLRLGEGTGSALALPLLHAAVNFLAQMATFSSAQVSEKSV